MNKGLESLKVIVESNIELSERYIYDSLKNALENLNNIYKNTENFCFYNDVFNSSDHIPLIKKIDYKIPRLKSEKIKIGEDVHCLSCGGPVLQIGESMFCADCLLEKTNLVNSMVDYCPRCGERFKLEDGVWSDQYSQWEELICPDCANSES